MRRNMTVAEYLIGRLEQLGLQHIFGIPGDYVLGFYELLSKSPISLVGTCTEIGAGFAAEAYARRNGLGAVCTTYCVGGFNLINPVAQAYAERAPLLVISGAPGLSERVNSPLLHHRVRGFDTQHAIFERITAAAVAIEDPVTAAHQIDVTIETCLRLKRPAYIELPRDMLGKPCGSFSSVLAPQLAPSDPSTLEEAVSETTRLLRAAKRPVIVAGVELHRFGLQGDLLALAEKSHLPVAVTLLDKSVISEKHPQYLGVYEGAIGRNDVRRTVESSDCLLVLGSYLTDINLGGFTSNLVSSRIIHATSERISVRHHHYDGVTLADFVQRLCRADFGSRPVMSSLRSPRVRPFKPIRGRALTVRRFFAQLQSVVTGDSIVITDCGESMFGASDLTIHQQTQFLGSAYYLCMGYSIPAALGAQLNDRAQRPLVIVGDGAFQMTCQELSTIVEQGLNPIVIVMNNKGYSTQRVISDGPYNNIRNWTYHAWPQVMNGGFGLEARTEDELAQALARASEHTTSYVIVNVHLDPHDHSDVLRRLGGRLREKVRG